MGWIAGVLAIFLFYKFVERKHKIIFFKVVGVIALIGAIDFGGFFGYYEYEKKNKKADNESLRISYIYLSSTLSDDEKVKIASNIFAKFQQERPELSKLTKDQKSFVKNVLNKHVYIESKTRENILGKTKEEESLSWDVIFEKDAEKKSKMEQKFAELKKSRLEKYLKELPADRKNIKTDSDKALHGYKMYTLRSSFGNDSELFKKLDSAMLPWERSAIDRIEYIREDESEKYRDELTDKKADSKLSIEICNDRLVPLNSYSFSISGYKKGRSTRHALTKDSYGDSTRLNGDIIVEPNSCSTIVWTDKYTFYDRYEISSVSGTWTDND